MNPGGLVNEFSPLLRQHAVPMRRAGRARKRRHERRTLISNSADNEQPEQLAPSFISKPLVNDYLSIDFLQDLAQDSHRPGWLRRVRFLREKVVDLLDQASGSLFPAVIGALTACVAFLVDIAEGTVSSWKQGYCVGSPFLTREACCRERDMSWNASNESGQCTKFQPWSGNFGTSLLIFLSLAMGYGLISSCVTLLTKHTFQTMAPDPTAYNQDCNSKDFPDPQNHKTMYMASGSGIPELRTILGGFEIPNFLTFKVMCVKAVGAVFAVATGMCLGKEGPFVHISACMGNIVAQWSPRYRSSRRRIRELLSVSCAAGLSVAFGAPIGGVLFSYEEISTYFPRKVLWKAFLCSLTAAMVLRELNPTGTGKLVLFETKYEATYSAGHYFVFVLLGIAGGMFGAVFCTLNFLWSRWFRSFRIINRHPTLETALVVLATVLLQYPNVLAREPGDAIIRNLLVDCRKVASRTSVVCQSEAQDDRFVYYCYLIAGCLTKLVLTIVTFGLKVPSGVIIPFLDAGAYFGRFAGQAVPNVPPGVFAMVGAGAFLAGVSRMTISLGVIMLELTGELDYVVPNMVAILVAKWVADGLCPGGVYELAQVLQGHPFLNYDHSITDAQGRGITALEIVEPGIMQHIALAVPGSNKIRKRVLVDKVKELKALGFMNVGLVLVQNDYQLQGHLDGGELDSGLQELDMEVGGNDEVWLLDNAGVSRSGMDLSHLTDRAPVTVLATAPLEHVIYTFGQLGVRRLIVLENGTGRALGIIDKWRLIMYLDEISHK